VGIAGSHAPVVNNKLLGNSGLATPNCLNNVDGACEPNLLTITLAVTSITPNTGSTQGGTQIVIVGKGFSSIVSDNVILIGANVCIVSAASFTSITCITSAGTGVQSLSITVNGYVYNNSN